MASSSLIYSLLTIPGVARLRLADRIAAVGASARAAVIEALCTIAKTAAGMPAVRIAEGLAASRRMTSSQLRSCCGAAKKYTLLRAESREDGLTLMRRVADPVADPTLLIAISREFAALGCVDDAISHLSGVAVTVEHPSELRIKAALQLLMTDPSVLAIDPLSPSVAVWTLHTMAEDITLASSDRKWVGETIRYFRVTPPENM